MYLNIQTFKNEACGPQWQNLGPAEVGYTSMIACWSLEALSCLLSCDAGSAAKSAKRMEGCAFELVGHSHI